MSKQIQFTYKDVDYLLEFNRATIKQMEREGYSVTIAQNMPVTFTDAALKYAFKKNHRDVNDATIEEIRNALGDKAGLTEYLIEMISEVVESLNDEPKNAIKWKALK